jgi:hypothetical protein
MAADSLATPVPTRLLPTRAGLLRWALGVDAAVTGVNGLAYLALAGPLHDLLGVPAADLRAIGAFLVVFAAGVGTVARRPDPPAAAVVAIVAANAAWAVASVVAAVADLWSPTAAGTVWTVLQAGVVALFAALQATGLHARAGR